MACSTSTSVYHPILRLLGRDACVHVWSQPKYGEQYTLVVAKGILGWRLNNDIEIGKNKADDADARVLASRYSLGWQGEHGHSLTGQVVLRDKDILGTETAYDAEQTIGRKSTKGGR